MASVAWDICAILVVIALGGLLVGIKHCAVYLEAPG
jgi:hypothetical protein